MSTLWLPASQLPEPDPRIGDEMELRVKVRVTGLRQDSERISLRNGTGHTLRELIEPGELEFELLIGEIVDE